MYLYRHINNPQIWTSQNVSPQETLSTHILNPLGNINPQTKTRQELGQTTNQNLSECVSTKNQQRIKLKPLGVCLHRTINKPKNWNLSECVFTRNIMNPQTKTSRNVSPQKHELSYKNLTKISTTHKFKTSRSMSPQKHQQPIIKTSRNVSPQVTSTPEPSPFDMCLHTNINSQKIKKPHGMCLHQLVVQKLWGHDPPVPEKDT